MIPEREREALMRLTMCAREECGMCKYKDTCDFDFQYETATRCINILADALNADRKTENSSEKPNNCEICKHWEYDAKYKWWHCPLQDNGMYECHYEPRKLTAVEDEPTISKTEQVEDEPQTEPLHTCSVNGRPYSECSSCEHFKCTADEPQTEDFEDWKDRMWAEAVIEPQTDCAWR